MDTPTSAAPSDKTPPPDLALGKEGMIFWRDDTALLLSTKSRVNIVEAVIDATDFKSPTHCPLRQPTFLVGV